MTCDNGTRHEAPLCAACSASVMLVRKYQHVLREHGNGCQSCLLHAGMKAAETEVALKLMGALGACVEFKASPENDDVCPDIDAEWLACFVAELVCEIVGIDLAALSIESAPKWMRDRARTVRNEYIDRMFGGEDE